MAATVNPYVVGLPVGGTDAFVGRTAELESLATVLSTGQTQAALLTGSPGIGRSSLLKQLESKLDAHGELHSVRINLQDRVWDPLDDVISHIADSVGRTLRITEPELGHWAENRFAERWLPLVLERIHEDDRIVFLFDEFPVVFDPRSRQAAGALLPWFAGLLEQFPGRFRAVFTTDLRLQNQEAIFRRYFPDLHRLELGSLRPEDARALVQLAHAKFSLHWSGSAVDHIEALCGGHPFFLQLLCSLVWKQHQRAHGPARREIFPIDVNALIERTIEAGTPVFESMWGGLPPECRVIAAALAWRDPPVVATDRTATLLEECGVAMVTTTLKEDGPAELRRQGLLHPRTDALAFRVPLFRRWIRTTRPLEVAFAALDQVVPEAARLFQVAERKWQTATREATRQEAVLQLAEVLRLNPNHTTATELLGMEYERRGEPDAALEYLERLYETQPSRARPKLVRILLQLAAKESTSARKARWYERVLQLSPGHPEATRARAGLFSFALRTGPSRSGIPAPQGLAPTEAAAAGPVDPLESRDTPPSNSTPGYAAAAPGSAAPVAPAEPGFESVGDIELGNLYDAARVALDVGDRATALRYLGQIAGEKPTYRETSRYLYMAVHNVDPAAGVAPPPKTAARTVRALQASTVVLAAALLVSIATRPTPAPTVTVQAISNRAANEAQSEPSRPSETPIHSSQESEHSTVPLQINPSLPSLPESEVHPDEPPAQAPADQARLPSLEPEPPPTTHSPASANRLARAEANAEALIQKGWTALEAGALEEAESFFEAAVSESPGSPDAHYSLAYAAEKSKRLDVALIHYCSALRYSPHGTVVQRDVEGRLVHLGMACD